MNVENNKILMFLFKIFFPRKYELYLKRKKEEERIRIEKEKRREEERKRREEERKNIEKFAMVGESLTFYLKKKKTGRTIVVKGTSFEDVKNQYGEEYDFVEPLIKNADEFDGMMWYENFNRWRQSGKTRTI